MCCVGALRDTVSNLYDTDFVAWTKQQADALRERRLGSVDCDNLIQELESMGKQQVAELTNRLAVLLAHLLKWQRQPDERGAHGRSWRLTVKEQRLQIARLMRKNPSLQAHVQEAINDAYAEAVVIAARETGLDEDAYPASCPYAFEQATTADWMPA